jgi:diguanylate cyclase (GGDEF)-like protein
VKASIVSGLAAAALIVVFAAIGIFTISSLRQADRNSATIEKAQAASEPLRAANEAAQITELRTLLWLATYDQQHRTGMFEAEADFELAVRQIGQSPVAADREFAAWVETYLIPMAAVLKRFGEEPMPPVTEITADLHTSYLAVYDSIIAGDLGDPHIADGMVDPRADGGTIPIKNPITAVMAFQVARHQAEVDKLASANRQAAQVFLNIAPALYGAGMVLIILLLVATLLFGRRQARTTAEIRQLRRLTTTDPLTGLGNRRGFEEATQRLTMVSVGEAASLIMMDLDQFKVVNDTFGHGRGDAVLALFADIIGELAPPGASRFRIGGDEFAVLLRGASARGAWALAERVRLAASDRLPSGVTVSAGVADLDTADPDADLLQQEADAALYEAKLRGRNLVVTYEGREDAPVFPATKLQAVRRLLEEGRIDPVFQPIWDIHKHALLGYEGLSRPHPDYDLDGPQQAFDIAEQFGRTADLDRLCRNHLLAAAQQLPPEGQLFINLSPYTLTHHSFAPSQLLAEIELARINPERVVFEVTEKSHVPPQAIGEAVRELRKLGFSVALDDVGAGNNGLEMLRNVPFEYVKIDRAVLISACETGTGRAALMAILAFAAESGAVVIAEGIDDGPMFRTVQEIAHSSLRGDPGLIHAVQGFRFGRPAPAANALQQLPGELAA